MATCMGKFTTAICLAVSSFVVTAATEVATEMSVLAVKAPRSLALDLQQLSGGRLIAVGERGHVLLSDDKGQNWRQVQVPTRATLTTVAARGDTVIAAGHDSVLLRSVDRGEHWSLIQNAPENEKPVLDVFFSDDEHGFAIGAYGYFARSTDGGQSWQAEEVAAFDIADFGFPHLYRMTQLHDGRLILVGEAGFVARSSDNGRQWQRLNFPYEGTLFSVMETAAHVLIISGMRGHIFRSVDGGDQWTEIDSGTHSGLNDIEQDAEGHVCIAGMDGVLLRADADAMQFELQRRSNRKGVAALIASASGNWILAAEDGVSLYSWQDVASQAKQ